MKYPMILIVIILVFLSGCTNLGTENATNTTTVSKRPSSADSSSIPDYVYQGVTSDGALEYHIQNGEAAITYVLTDTALVTIPDNIDGFPVTSIQGGAFYQNQTCHSVRLPETLVVIESGAFYRCSNLESIFIPASVRNIAADAFLRAENLGAIQVSVDNPSFCDVDGVLLTKDMQTLLIYPEGKHLLEYSIPQCVNAIGEYAFGYFPKTSRILVSSSVITFPEDAFCVLTEMITIVTERGSAAESYAYSFGISCEVVERIP